MRRFQDLKDKFGLTSQDNFRYLQIGDCLLKKLKQPIFIRRNSGNVCKCIYLLLIFVHQLRKRYFKQTVGGFVVRQWQIISISFGIVQL